MPTKRRPINRPLRRRVTEAAVDAFERRDWHALFFALDWRPWKPSPLDVPTTGDPPDGFRHEMEERFYREAQALRVELEAAVAARKGKR